MRRTIELSTHLLGQLLLARREGLDRLVQRVVAHARRLVRAERLLLLVLPLSPKRLVGRLEIVVILAELVHLRATKQQQKTQSTRNKNNNKKQKTKHNITKQYKKISTTNCMIYVYACASSFP